MNLIFFYFEQMFKLADEMYKALNVQHSSFEGR